MGKRSGLLLGLAALPLAAQSLQVRLQGGLLRVSAPHLRFLTGKPLERLHNGAPVAFMFQLTLSTDGHATPLARDTERYVLSYDLWEEKFSVVKLGHPPRSAARLSEAAAQAFCVEDLSLPASGLPAGKPLWVKLEVRVEEPREPAALESETPLSLSRLIDTFSRRARAEQTRWTAQAGPLRLSELAQ